MQTDWTSLVLTWMPFFVLIAVWFVLSRSAGVKARGASGATMIELYEQQLAETRRMNVMLERIAVTLEKHEPSPR